VDSNTVAFVPARAGSKRIPGKNVRLLGGHPLLAYSVAAARASGVFDRVIVSTDSEQVAQIATAYGAEVPFLRPAELAHDRSPDIEWVRHAIGCLRADGDEVDVFAILRPTSPLRGPETIRAAVATLMADTAADSLRGVEPVTQHPGKMWVVDADLRRMRPLLDDGGAHPPWHSTPYQALPRVHVQNASLEVARVRCVDEYDTIAGREIIPFVLPGHEGVDLNDPVDWLLLERLLESGEANLPALARPPMPHAAPH
jgi:CMP-N,N'-diacetyllegionaminic acid synthase